jgi:hypothetical protein
MDSALLWSFLGALAVVRATHIEERDPYWQVRAGLENLAGLPLARPDTWTWSGAPGDWYPNSPLWNLLLGLSYQTAGFWGLSVLSAATILCLFGVTMLLARRLGSRPLPGLLGLLMVCAGAYPMLNARATLAVQVLLLGAVYLVLRLGDHASGRSWGTLAAATFLSAAALSVTGNWLHLSFLVLAPVLAVVWALVWMLTPGLPARERVLLSLAGAGGWVLGCLLSPYGVATGLARSLAVQEACQGLVIEWSSPLQPGLAGRSGGTLVMLTAALVLAGATVWWIARQWLAGNAARDLLAIAVLGVPAALAGVVALRFLGVALLTLAPVAAAAATRLADDLRRALHGRPGRAGLKGRLAEYGSGRFWRIVLTATLVLLSPGVLFLAGEHAVPAERAVAGQLPPRCRLFSRPGIASAVELLRPDVPVWMDGRADFFGRSMLVETVGYLEGTGPDPVPHGTTCVLIGTRTDPSPGLRERLRNSAEWRLSATGGSFELWLPVAAG